MENVNSTSTEETKLAAFLELTGKMIQSGHSLSFAIQHAKAVAGERYDVATITKAETMSRILHGAR